MPAGERHDGGGAAQVRGAPLAWSEQGSGPLVVRAHGLQSSRRSEAASGLLDWSPVAGAGRRLVSYDARGHGRSGGEAEVCPYTWPSLAADLLALLDHLEPGRPVSGIGLSMGTGTLLHAAVTAPGRFDRLVLTAPPTAWSTRPAQAEMYVAGAEVVEQQGFDAFARMLAAAPVPPVFQALPERQPPDVAAGLLPSVLRGAAASDLPDETSIGALDIPVLVLAWAGDPAHPVDTAERLHSLIAGSRLEVSDTEAAVRHWPVLAARFLTD